MDSSKVRLSKEEKILVTNREWILTKHRVIDKVYALFGELSEQMKQQFAGAPVFKEGELERPAKISKGERYGDMPWVTLDYPRFFSKDDVLAIRSFFWWGHYFSITLHLKGVYWAAYRNNISRALGEGLLQGFYLSCDGDEFDFDLDGTAYILQEGQNGLRADFLSSGFFKIGQKLALDDWEAVRENLPRLFSFYAGLLET